MGFWLRNCEMAGFSDDRSCWLEVENLMQKCVATIGFDQFN